MLDKPIKKRQYGALPRLNVLELQRYIRTMPKPVIALVAGYAIGGGHVLHIVCDLTIAADNARFGQTGPKVGSFDAGFGSNERRVAVGHGGKRRQAGGDQSGLDERHGVSLLCVLRPRGWE